jgi:hypothetical protein
MNPNWDKIDDELHNLNSKCVSAISGNGIAYIATVPGVDELYDGLEITIIPNINSASKTITLDVNSLGAKNVRLPLSFNTTAVTTPTLDNWLSKDKPIKLMYDGTQWKANIQRTSANTLYGSVPIENGGTGADSRDDARTNLGISSVRVDTTISSWDTTMTLSNDAITETCPIELLPGVDITRDQLKALQAALIVGSTQEVGKLTYKCLGTIPSVSIPVTFIIRRDL